MIRITLALPPSDNDMDEDLQWKRMKARRAKKAYYRAAHLAIRDQQGPGYEAMTGDVQWYAVVRFANNRVADIANRVKVLQDALTYARVWNDDRQVKRFAVCHGGVVDGGDVDVFIETYSGIGSQISGDEYGS